MVSPEVTLRISSSSELELVENEKVPVNIPVVPPVSSNLTEIEPPPIEEVIGTLMKSSDPEVSELSATTVISAVSPSLKFVALKVIETATPVADV